MLFLEDLISQAAVYITPRSTVIARWLNFFSTAGADRNLKDTKVDSTAAGWAEYGGHPELRDLLQ